MRVVSGWYDGDWMEEPFEYDTRGKPCALVVEHAVVAFPEALTRRFPEAKPAIDMGLESYLAVCLRAADASHLGHIAVMDAHPMRAGATTSRPCASSPRERRPSSSVVSRRPPCGARAPVHRSRRRGAPACRPRPA